MNYRQREIEYSKEWIRKNPQLFAEGLLEFLAQHHSDSWDFALTQTDGFVTLYAALKVPA